MTLYHFTSVAAFPQIFSDGLPSMDGSKGFIMPSPDDATKGFPTPFGWLTSDGDFRTQDWAPSDSPKLGCRIEVKAHDYEALPWSVVKEQLNPLQIAILESGSKDTSKWYVLLKPLTRERFGDEAAVNPDRDVPNLGNQN